MRSHSSPIVSTDIFLNMWVHGFVPRNCPATNCGFTKVYLLTTNNTKSETSSTLGSSKHPGRTSNRTRCRKSAVEAVNEVLLIQLKEGPLVGNSERVVKKPGWTHEIRRPCNSTNERCNVLWCQNAWYRDKVPTRAHGANK